MSEIENGRLGLYGTKRSKCNHLMTLGFKGLSAVVFNDVLQTVVQCTACATIFNPLKCSAVVSDNHI